VLKCETSVWLTELPAWLVLGGLESVVCLRIERDVRGTEVMAERTSGCVATSRRKGAGSERRVLGGIVVAWRDSCCSLRTWSMMKFDCRG
jgi:hypothetical protein